MSSIKSVYLAIFAFALAGPALASPKSSKVNSKPQDKVESFDFGKSSFKEILDRYVFIADFSQKPGERPVSKEVFWKYPFKLAPVVFDLALEGVDMNSMVFQVKGSGARTEAMNIGRVEFLDGSYAKAHEAWLTGRQEFKDDAKANRLFDFFLAINALSAYREKLKIVQGDLQNPEVQAISKRAAYFLASTYLQKKDSPDERIDKYAPWGLYNLAAIYYRYGRLRSVFGAAQEGLSTLLKQGSVDFRSEFRQLLAEAYIKNQDLMSAIQELDTAIRQDPNQYQATRMFSRAADIYYDLNNYELAEDFYAMASAIDRERRIYNPAQAILRAESIFWLGRFQEAEKIFRGSVEYIVKHGLADDSKVNQNVPWAALRIADAMLAQSIDKSGKDKNSSLEKARLAYFRVETEYPKTEAAQIAMIRGACLELPGYQGNNVKHARAFLQDVKDKNEVSPLLMEMVWACDAGSYSDREKSDQMVAKVREFADKYPRSRFLDAMLAPVRDVQASKINDYFAKQQWESATDFFEQRKASLFQKIPNDIAANLWTAYVATGRSSSALQFWPAKSRAVTTDIEALRQAAFLFEATSQKQVGEMLKERDKLNSLLIKRKWSNKPSEEEASYLKRVLATRQVAVAYPWIMNLQQAWYTSDEKSTCESLFPLLSRVIEDKKSGVLAKNMAYGRIKNISEEVINKIRGSDPSCFQSWVDLEGKVLELKDMQKKYTLRGDWPLEGAWLDRAWALSEQLNQVKQRQQAVPIWQKIAEKAPKDSFESRMARTRLDPNKTEFESLWK